MPSHDEEALGARIRRLRKAKKLSQAKLADKIGVRSRAVIRWEHGEYIPGEKHRKALARTLGASVEELTPSPDEALTPLYRRVLERVDAQQAEIDQLRALVGSLRADVRRIGVRQKDAEPRSEEGEDRG